VLDGHKIAVIIPALNEEASLGLVITELPMVVDHIIVADNGSTDGTAAIARSVGAVVVTEPERGYGAACLRAIAEVSADTDILLFLDADHSDFPGEAESLLRPIVEGRADLVIGSRMLTYRHHRALPPVAAFGNWLTSRLIKLIWRVRFTDIGPFRAIRFDAYRRLGMMDRNFGWTTEMQVRAVKLRLRCIEVPVSYRARLGRSKVSGTVSGSIRAGSKFLWIIIREAVRT
jgi:glycosyltransferase involved in cell wall biosynthesis